MPSLSSYPNVWETCLQLLHRRGYHLEVRIADEEDDVDTDAWLAEKDGFTFWGDNPIELLGLTAVYEDVRPAEDQDYWWSEKTARDRPSLREQLVDRAVAAQDARLAELLALRAADPRAWEERIRAAFEVAGPGDELAAANRLAIPCRELRRLLDDPRVADLRA
jgi:hypothetical protein